uniref:Tetratricopeptide repeat protein n=1 Tax=candidate division WOR-3 bacterium TaxID=2052148 RepID=A0A7C4XT82_UNCW3
MKLKVAIFTGAILLRLFYIFQMQKNDPFFYNLFADGLQYHQLALGVLKKGVIGTEAFYHPPLYQYFLALLYRIFGINLLVVRIIQAFLGGVNTLLIYSLTRRYFNKTIAIVAGFIAALYPMLIFFDGEILAPTLLIFLTLAGLFFLDTKDTQRLFWAGILFGLATITSQNILLFIFFFPFYLLIKYKKLIIKYLIIFWTGAFLVILPIFLRNILVLKEPIFISWQGGVNFYIGNNPRSTGITGIPPGSTKRDWYSAYLELKQNIEKEVGHTISLSEFDRICYKKGIEFIIKNPVKTLARLIKKSYLFFSGFEVSSERDIYFATQYSFLRFILFKLPFLQFPFGILTPLLLVGLYYTRKRWRQVSHLLFFIILYSLSYIIFFVNARYRMPVIPIMIIFGSYGVITLFNEWNKKRVIPELIIFVVAYLIFNANLYQITDPQQYLTKFQIAQIDFSQGRYELALNEITSSINDNPNFAEGHNLRGLILKAMGRIYEAEQEFLKTINIDNRFPDAYINLGNIAIQKGELSRAEVYYTQAVAIDTNHPIVYNNLGNVYFQKGLYAEALKYYTRALRIDPNYTSPIFHSGLIYARTGNLAKAESLWLEVLKIDPSHQGARRALETFIKKGTETNEK